MIIRAFCEIPQVGDENRTLNDELCKRLIPKNKQAFSEGGTKC